MKKALLVLSMSVASLAATAQVTWFSQTVGDNTAGSMVGLTSGYGAIRLDNGHFVGVGVSDGSGLQVKEYDTNGALLSTRENVLGTFQWSMISSVNALSGGDAVLVAGLAQNTTSFESRFVLARINLATSEVSMVTNTVTGFSYTAGPDVSVTNDAVFVVYPHFNKVQTARFDHDLDPVWNRCVVPDSGDTIAGKFPSMGGSRCDSGIVVTCKDDSSYGQSRMTEGGTLLSYTVYRGPGYVRIYNVSTANDGNVIISGLYSPYYASGMDSRPLIGKMTPNGDVMWVKVLDKYTASPSMRRFVNAQQMPDGSIYAFGSLEEAYNDSYFDGVCVFDANGNLTSAKRFGDASRVYFMYDAKFYNDGILLAGVIQNWTTSTYENTMMFTDYDFGQVCGSTELTMSNVDHDLGPKVTRDASGMTVWNGSTNAEVFPTLASMTDAQPVTCTSVTGVNDGVNAALVVYPNPAAAGTEVLVDFGQAGEYTLTVVDVTGKTLMTRTVTGSQSSVATSTFAPGMYMVNVKNSAGSVSSQKLIVR
jgi:hypothetical protein